MTYCTVAKTMGWDRPICVRLRVHVACALRPSQSIKFRLPYSWITMRRSLRKRRVFDFVPSYLKRFWNDKMNLTESGPKHWYFKLRCWFGRFFEPCGPISHSWLISISSWRKTTVFLLLWKHSQLLGMPMAVPSCLNMVQTSKTDHFCKLAPFRSCIDGSHWFWYGWKATDWLQIIGDVLRWLRVGHLNKAKKSMIGCWAPKAATCGQSAPSQIQLIWQATKVTTAIKFRSAFLGQSSLLKCVHEENRAVHAVGSVFSWRTSLAPMDGSEIHGYCMHGRNLASDRQGYFVKRPRKNTRTQQIYAKTSWQISGVFFERSTNSSERVNREVLVSLAIKAGFYEVKPRLFP